MELLGWLNTASSRHAVRSPSLPSRVCLPPPPRVPRVCSPSPTARPDNTATITTPAEQAARRIKPSQFLLKRNVIPPEVKRETVDASKNMKAKYMYSHMGADFFQKGEECLQNCLTPKGRQGEGTNFFAEGNRGFCENMRKKSKFF